MGIFNFWKTTPMTDSQLPDAKLVATTAMSGNIYQTPNASQSILNTSNIPFESVIGNPSSVFGTGNNTLLWNLSIVFQDYYSQLFKYEGSDELDMKYAENQLFWQGAVAVFKMYDYTSDTEKFFTLPFIVEKYDYLMFPKTVKPIFPNKEVPTKSLTVGKDCVILYSSYNSFFTANMWMFGKLYQLWNRFNELVTIYNEIKNNTLLTRERLLIPATTQDDQNFDSLVQQFLLGDPILKIDPKSLETLALQGLNLKGSSFIPFKDRTVELWTNFQNTWNMIKEIAYVPHNAGNSSKKERMIVDEVNADNCLVESGITTMLDYREKFCKDMKKVFGIDLSVVVRSREESEELLEQSLQENMGENENE